METKQVVDEKKNHLIELLEAKLTRTSKRASDLEEKYLQEVNGKEEILTGQSILLFNFT